MKHRFLSLVLSATFFCALLAACTSAPASSAVPVVESSSVVSSTGAVSSVSQPENVPAEGESEPVSQPVVKELSSGLTAEELEAVQKEFQNVFDQFEPSELYEGQYSNCPHYTIVGDYDGDGKPEAFGFIGLDSDWQPAPFWESLSIYYIDSLYRITPLVGNDSEYDSVNGSILCPEATIKDDFSNCVYTSGTEQFLAWNVAYWDGDWFGLILSAHNGVPEVSYLSSIFYVNDNGQFATFDSDYNEILLQLKNGQMVNT